MLVRYRPLGLLGRNVGHHLLVPFAVGADDLTRARTHRTGHLAAGMTGGTPDFTLAGAAIAGDFVFLFKIFDCGSFTSATITSPFVATATSVTTP